MELFLYSFGSAVFSAISALMQKIILRKIGAITFSFFVSLFIAILVFVYVFFNEFPVYGITEYSIFLLKTILSALAFLFVMLSIKKFELSSVLPILAFTPALVAIFAFLFLDEKLSFTNTIGLVLMISGFYLIEAREHNIFMPLKDLIFKSSGKYIAFAMLLFVVTSLLDKTLISSYSVNPKDFIILQQIFSFPIFAVIFFFSHEKSTSNKNFPKGLIFPIISVSIFTLAYRFLYVTSLQFGPVAIALSLKRLSVLIAVILSGKLLREKNISLKIFASILILLGAYLSIM